MPRFILRYQPQGPAPEAEVARVRADAGVTVLDASAPRMLLVDASEPAVASLMAALPDWSAAPEVPYSVPDPRRRPHSERGGPDA